MVLEVQQVSGDIDACGGVPEQQPDAGFLRLLAGKEADGRLLCFAGASARSRTSGSATGGGDLGGKSPGTLARGPDGDLRVTLGNINARGTFMNQVHGTPPNLLVSMGGDACHVEGGIKSGL